MSDNRIKNRNRRIFKKKLNNLTHCIRNMILAVVVLVFTFIAVVFVAHQIETKNEIEILKKAELYNQIAVDDSRTLNVVLYGNKNSEHTIVTISDIGVQDFSVFVKNIAYEIKDKVQFALIDRAGYGFSDDSMLPQTVEQIVSYYRIALKNASVEGPYILLAHEFGSVYATYWEQNYSDEVEAIIYVDGTEIIETQEITGKDPEKEDYIKAIVCKLGGQRMMYHDFYTYSSKLLSEQEADCSKSLNTHSACSLAYLSELSLMDENFKQVYDNFTHTNTPKMYISSSNSFNAEKEVIRYFEYKNEQYEELGLEPFYVFVSDKQTSKDAAKFIEERQRLYENNTKTFVNALGNCLLTNIPGDSKIYEQQTVGLTNAIADFLLYIDGERESIELYYDDTILINWEQYQEIYGSDELINSDNNDETEEIQSEQNND